jgi:hypothetical protein
VANGLQPVRPGQVISSGLINDIIAAILALQAGGSQSSSGIVISSFDPINQQSIGLPLTINGSGFPTNLVDGTVTLNGTPVPAANFVFGTSNKALKFTVPPIPGVVSAPTAVTVAISGPNGTARAGYTLLPSLASGPPATITSITDNVTSVKGVVGVGHQITIAGTNFAPSPGTANVISFSLTPPGSTTPIVYPKSGQSLTIDPSSNTTQIVVTVPNITEITSNMGTVSASLSVANGTNTPAVVPILLFHP